MDAFEDFLEKLLKEAQASAKLSEALVGHPKLNHKDAKENAIHSVFYSGRVSALETVLDVYRQHRKQASAKISDESKS